MSRVAALSPGGQRWLKTAIHAIRTMPGATEDEERRPRPLKRREPPEQSPPGLEDVITGRADLKDLDAYPDLAGELEGLGEIIDMLRGLGEARRKRGEQILREDILGQPGDEAHDDEEDFSF